jgi:hypothetical protein
VDTIIAVLTSESEKRCQQAAEELINVFAYDLQCDQEEKKDLKRVLVFWRMIYNMSSGEKDDRTRLQCVAEDMRTCYHGNTAQNCQSYYSDAHTS